jgi:hypothetical protein
MPRRVEVKVEKDDDANTFTIGMKPWRLGLQQGDKVHWSLTDDSCANELEIAHKDPGNEPEWPFNEDKPKGNPARANWKSHHIPIGRRTYTVTVICTSGETVIIMDVDE